MDALEDIRLSSRLERLDSLWGYLLLPIGVAAAGVILGVWAADAFVAGFQWALGIHLAGEEVNRG